ncbi:hypothetical protein TRFO_26949 [Tritrichomonas foetus]|uniref:Uncharacterized protein n=1 Tax=Tritrichomonas foetus TaxID=1144522 RepID=A0A1J4K265_9EUKA|nr:hypothetical protein TRFO_26949 [Tritrichomonas foetus]|eukprot:OHT05323.1 hypothetical protein TRFO_26949 [Tritrichomonas foetus]
MFSKFQIKDPSSNEPVENTFEDIVDKEKEIDSDIQFSSGDDEEIIPPQQNPKLDQKNEKPFKFQTLYPIFGSFFPKIYQSNSLFKFPQKNTPVFIEWESVIIDAIQNNNNTIESIKHYVLGSWFLDTSNQFMQINHSNLDIYISPEILKETLFFQIENETISLTSKKDCKPFIFQNNSDLPFEILVINTANNLQQPFTIDELFNALNQKMYRTHFNSKERITKEDSLRIEYIVSQSPYFLRNEDGSYIKSNVVFGSISETEFIEARNPENEIVNLMIKFAPIGHLFYKSELKKIMEKAGKFQGILNFEEIEKQLIKHERVFFYNDRFGVRHKTNFVRQLKIRKNEEFNEILFESIIFSLTSLIKPVSIASLFSILKNLPFVDDTKQIQVFSEKYYRHIRYFLNCSPFIFCKKKKFYMIPRYCECDYFGYIYLSSINYFFRKHGKKAGDMPMIHFFNTLRIPIKKNEATFIQLIKHNASEIANAFHSSEKGMIEGNSDINVILPLFDSSDDDGKLSKDFTHNELEQNDQIYKTSQKSGNILNKNNYEVARLHLNSKSSIESTRMRELNNKEKAIDLLSSEIKKRNQESSEDFQKRAKRKKVLLDSIPDSKSDESLLAENDDFENDDSLSDLEKCLIRLARKYYNPNTMKYFSAKAFAETLKDTEVTNKDGITFSIDNSVKSLELITNELIHSNRFISSKGKKKFCYSIKNRSSSPSFDTISDNSQSISNNTLTEKIDLFNEHSDDQETNLNNNLANNPIIDSNHSKNSDLMRISIDVDNNENENAGNNNIPLPSDNEESIEGTLSEINIFNKDDDEFSDISEIENENDDELYHDGELINTKWEPPKLQMDALPTDEKPIDVINMYHRDKIVKLCEYEIKNVYFSEWYLNQRLQIMYKNKAIKIPSNEQIYSLYEKFGNGKSLEDFKDYVIQQFAIMSVLK